MPLELKERYSLKLQIEGAEIEVYFRKPNASEMVRYLAFSFANKDSERISQALQAGIELAFCCLLGIKSGDLVLVEQDGTRVLITEPTQPGYEPNWKEILREKLPGLFLFLSNHLLKTSRAELEVREKN